MNIYLIVLILLIIGLAYVSYMYYQVQDVRIKLQLYDFAEWAKKHDLLNHHDSEKIVDEYLKEIN